MAEGFFCCVWLRGGVSAAYSLRSRKALGLSHIEWIPSRMWCTFLTLSCIAAVLSRLAWNHSPKDMRFFLQSIYK